ncbi:hypothetical protein [Hyphomicrobium sp.]|uniref:hypothetical protein n=1 Tax=Hyphomicrobium sp. TaxID=82 RepID=UPI002E37759E|nr:hypothetical protein [Hyphomicrobium sp.]HEX2840439.1 hypothetical protein [Hyphomicrobium sp.]
MTKWRVALVMLAAGLFAFPASSWADMGKAPVGAKGYILGFEGGYLFQDGPEVTGHGIVLSPGGSTHDVKVSPEDGYFVGGMVGYDNGTPYLFGFHRVELFLLYGEADDSERDRAPPLSDIVLKTVDGAILGSGGGLTGRTTVERKSWEFGFRLEDDDTINSTTTVTWVLSPFIRNFDEDTDTLVTTATCCGGCCEFRRGADVDSWLYGVYVAAEPETWLTSNFALVARLGAGIYGYDADGKFRSSSTAVAPDLFAAHVSDGDSGVGFRGLLGAGLKFKISSTAQLEGFAEADYFSDVPTAHLTSNDPSGGLVSHVQSDDLWELRSGLRLTLGLGSSPN